MTRFVFDTNTVVSALLFNASPPWKAFVRAIDHGTILISGSLVRELHDVLSRDKFDRYVSRDERDRFLESLIRESELIEITKSVEVCRDRSHPGVGNQWERALHRYGRLRPARFGSLPRRTDSNARGIPALGRLSGRIRNPQNPGQPLAPASVSVSSGNRI